MLHRSNLSRHRKLIRQVQSPCGRQLEQLQDSLPATSESVDTKLQQIDDWLANRNFVAAHRELSTLYWNNPELKSTILDRIEANAETIYFKPQPHFLEPYEIQSGDYLQRVGSEVRNQLGIPRCIKPSRPSADSRWSETESDQGAVFGVC